uniref:Uncharacterized protein n=1 Tax=Rhizophora mucronata TaxID=61149 RepID=A0A2P2NR81_RHIMU
MHTLEQNVSLCPSLLLLQIWQLHKVHNLQVPVSLQAYAVENIMHYNLF